MNREGEADRHGWLRPDRLEARWRDEPAPPPPAASDDHPSALCERLRVTAGARFADGAAIRLIIDELARLVARRFPRDAVMASGEDEADLARRIEELITAVEDLADAALLGGAR
jgi:hypothetical protein